MLVGGNYWKRLLVVYYMLHAADASKRQHSEDHGDRNHMECDRRDHTGSRVGKGIYYCGKLVI